MTTIEINGISVEVTDEFAREYAEMEHRDKLLERKETRRHQSLDKSMEHGWEPPDPNIDIEESAIRLDERRQLRSAMQYLTGKQKLVLFFIFIMICLSGRSEKDCTSPKLRLGSTMNPQ